MIITAIKKLLKKMYEFYKHILNYINDKIILNKFKNKYNIIKLKKTIAIDECIICLDELSSITNNYKCKFCSASFHDKCFIKYIKLYQINSCFQCKQ